MLAFECSRFIRLGFHPIFPKQPRLERYSAMKMRRSAASWSCILCLYLAVNGALAQSSSTDQPSTDSAQHGFPAMLDTNGNKLADGEFSQWIEDGLLHVTIDYNFPDGRRIEEKSSLQQTPRLIQQEWSWTESRSGQTLRHFEVDFKSGKATAEKQVGNQMKRWTKNIKVDPGRTFAGFAFVLAIKRDHDRLANGEKITLQAAGLTPKPRVVSVEISYRGPDRLTMAGRTVPGEHFIVHPKVPTIAKLFVTAQDTHIWLTTPPAISFLRWQGPLVEAADPIVRVDLLPGRD